MKFVVGVLYVKLLRRPGFRENGHIDRHKVINEFLSVLSWFLDRFRWNSL